MIELAVGTFRLALIVVPLVYAAIGTQRRIVPDAVGATAALYRVIIGLSIALATLELIGTVGQFRPWVIVVGEAAVGMAIGSLTGGWRRARPSARPQQPSPGPAARLAIAVTAVVVAAWVLLSWWIGRRGVMDNDSVRYHGPFVVRWFQVHSITHLHFTSIRLQETFFPANSELLSSMGIAAYRSDWLTPLLDVGWLALALLAGWTIVDGPRRPFGLLAVAAVAGSPLLLAWQPGSARNDMAAAALVLAALSLVRHARWRMGPLVVAGAAAGLAVGTKLSVLAPLVVITLGLPLIAPAGRRLGAATAWILPMCATGGFWYVRNWVRTGNPLPWYHIDIGPVHLPSPPFVYVAAEGQSIADYAHSSHFWTHTVVDGLHHALGPGWPLFVVACAVSIGLALRSRERLVVLISVATAAAVVADVFTPYSAGGLHGPTLFQSQLRFLTLAAIMALLGAVMTLDVRHLWVLPALTLVLLGLALANIPGYTAHVVGLVAVLGLLVAAALRPWPSVPWRRVTLAAVAVAVICCIPFSQWYDAHRYRLPDAQGAHAAFAYFRHVHHARVAVGTLMHTYPLSGPDLSNYVQTVGTPGPHGAFFPASNCTAWQRLIDQGRYSYVVTGYAHHLSGPPPLDQRWTARMPNAHLVMHNGNSAVFRMRGPRRRPDCPPTVLTPALKRSTPTATP